MQEADALNAACLRKRRVRGPHKGHATGLNRKISIIQKDE